MPIILIILRPAPMRHKVSAIYSIGHGIKKIEIFLEELKSFHIEYLIDVSSKPFSRFNPQFNKKALEQSLKADGITYVFMGDELGGRAEDVSCYTDGKVDYNLLAQKDFFKSGIDRLLTAHGKGIKLAIMCSETKPTECHRSRLIGKELLKNGINVMHITAPNKFMDQPALEAEGELFQH